MKQVKRAFAMLLCMVMVLSLCVVYAVADDVPIYGVYETLDAVPEDFKIFRSIRTGSCRYDGYGDYYEFYETDFPKVRIKRSAFMTTPTNDYLKADVNALSRNWGTLGGTSRICYYKTMTVKQSLQSLNGSSNMYTHDLYTVSMYRLELRVDSTNSKEIEVEAKLKSGVTFEYDTGKANYQALTKKNMLPLKPVPKVKISNSSQDVHWEGYTLEGHGPSCDDSDLLDVANSFSSINSCREDVVAVFAAPEVSLALKAVVGCSLAIRDVAEIAKDAVTQQYSSGYTHRVVYNSPLTVFPPAKLASSSDYFKVRFNLNTNSYDRSKTNFTVEFDFK